MNRKQKTQRTNKFKFFKLKQELLSVTENRKEVHSSGCFYCLNVLRKLVVTLRFKKQLSTEGLNCSKRQDCMLLYRELNFIVVELLCLVDKYCNFVRIIKFGQS